jgi:hypothetical protein
MTTHTFPTICYNTTKKDISMDNINAVKQRSFPGETLTQTIHRLKGKNETMTQAMHRLRTEGPVREPVEEPAPVEETTEETTVEEKPKKRGRKKKTEE